jgi:Kef-type K+ transport system membrane component KefB
MHEPVNFLAGLIRSHIAQVSLGITAVSLMLAGPLINTFVQNATQKLHWLLRYCIFILMCTVGYGLLTHFVFRGLARWLVYQRSTELLVITVGIYCVLAFFAKKQGHI